MLAAIEVNNLSKTYHVPTREPGLKAALKSLLRPGISDVPAVRDVSFSIKQGEMVGFIGANGAGKTTTLKMMAGLLYPTGGSVTVAGFQPFKRQKQFLKSISLVMGNKNQLPWDNTVADYFYILKEIYGISPGDYTERLEELTALLEIEPLLPKLARNLSLGERAKCELVAALLHRPQILFLDEPTLGLDVSMQLRIRSFLREYNQKYSTTVILTSHYMEDIMQLCQRVILIHRGQVLFDGDLNGLAARMAPFKLITIPDGKAAELPPALNGMAEVIERDHRQVTLRFRKEDLLAVTGILIKDLSIDDFTVKDPPIEAVIDQVYRDGAII
jgi:ABC-2 type transport system ATP-binding protein